MNHTTQHTETKKNREMREAIFGFAAQFAFEPKRELLENWENPAGVPGGKKSVILAGMGGSHLAGDILQMGNLPFRLSVHSDYGLPPHIPERELQESFLIASSYSGNTEETLDAFEVAREKGISLGVIASGGELLVRAKKYGVPFVEIPATGIQPRSALGFQFRALAKMLGLEEILEETKKLSHTLSPENSPEVFEEREKRGEAIAARLFGKVPIIYASRKNYALAYNWKIKMNETAKIPAFCNVFPEVNHNEMAGFDNARGGEEIAKLSQHFHVLFLTDEGDDARIQKRMKITQEMFREQGLATEEISLSPSLSRTLAQENSERENLWHKIFASLLLGDWVAYYLAEKYGAEASQVPMIEEFKKML